jgi:hypothetical protein
MIVRERDMNELLCCFLKAGARRETQNRTRGQAPMMNDSCDAKIV